MLARTEPEPSPLRRLYRVASTPTCAPRRSRARRSVRAAAPRRLSGLSSGAEEGAKVVHLRDEPANQSRTPTARCTIVPPRTACARRGRSGAAPSGGSALKRRRAKAIEKIRDKRREREARRGPRALSELVSRARFVGGGERAVVVETRDKRGWRGRRDRERLGVARPWRPVGLLAQSLARSLAGSLSQCYSRSVGARTGEARRAGCGGALSCSGRALRRGEGSSCAVADCGGARARRGSRCGVRYAS